MSEIKPVYSDYEDHEGEEVVNLAVYPALIVMVLDIGIRKSMKHCTHREPDHKYVGTTYDKWGDEIPPHWDYGEKDALVKYDKTHDQCRLCKQLVRNDR